MNNEGGMCTDADDLSGRSRSAGCGSGGCRSTGSSRRPRAGPRETLAAHLRQAPAQHYTAGEGIHSLMAR